MGKNKAKNPFVVNGKIKSPFRAILDRCILWPTPPPERSKFGIEIPETVRNTFQDGTATVLSVGPGFYDKSGKWNPTSDQLKPGIKVKFDNSVPWGDWVTGSDGRMYWIVICGVQDIGGVISEDE